MKYAPDFDSFCTTLAAICPAAYETFRSEFTGRSLSSMKYVMIAYSLSPRNLINLNRTIRSKKPRFMPGIDDSNFTALVEFMARIQVDPKKVPLGLSADDTKLHEGLRPYQDGCGSWRIAGVHGCVPEFTSYSELNDAISQHFKNKADKVCFDPAQIRC